MWADSTTDYHTDWLTMNYHIHGTRASVDTETPTPVSELRNLGESSNNILTRRINVDTSRVTISTGISSINSETQTSIPSRVSTIKNVKSFKDKLFGCNKKWARACGIKKKNEKHTFKSSATVTTVVLNTGTSLQEVVEKSDIDLQSTQTTEMTLQRSDIYTQSSSCCDSDTTTTTKSQDNDARSEPSIKTLQAGAKTTTETTISTFQTRHHLLNADMSSVTGPDYSTTSDSPTAARETASTAADSQTSPTSSLAKKKKASLGKKKTKKWLPNVTQLKMIIKLENASAFYPGISEGSPFHRGDQIIIDDPAFRDVQTFFFLKLDGNNGDTYADSLDNSDEFQNIQCMVDGLSPDIVYTGWHRWQHAASPGPSQLVCEANTIPSRYDTDYVADIPTTHPLWYEEPEQSVPGFEYLLSVQPFATGLYICIAADASYNVLLTSYLDIRVKTVVTSKNASITPQSVQIYTNDTQASFIFNHCRGKIQPQTTESVLAATTVFFCNLDDSNFGNASFTVSYLHTLLWRKAGWLFENLNLSSPMILQCKIAVSSNSDTSKSTMELYFRHESAKNRTHKAFTAIINETLNFSCKQLFARVPTQVNASYFEGNCSDRNASSINSGGSNITLTVNKQMCLICSSQSSQIKLQINIEDNYRTKLKATNRQNEKDNCSAILDMPTQLATVNESYRCEEFAVILSKEELENQNRTISFQPNTYKVYYTTRQFIVCQNQPVAWSIIGKHRKTLTPNDDDNYVLKVVAGVLCAIIALLAFFVWMKLSKGKQQPQEEQLDSVHTPHGFLAERQSNEKADATDELDFASPREHIEPSKISIGHLLGSGKFGKVYKACVKCKSLSSTDSALEVAVKELKAHFDNNAHNIGTVNNEIRIMRMIAPHLNVIKYYGYSLGVESNLLIMEMAEGPSLLEYLREQRIRVPGFELRLNYQGDYPDMKHALVGHKSSNSSSYLNATHEFFELRSNIEYPKDDSTNSVHSLCNDNEILKTEDCQQRNSQTFTDDISLSSMPDHDQWSSDYEDSNTERSVVEHTKQHCSEWSRRNSSAIESMSKEIFSICRQIARGMAHISALNIIHRDLAARNVVIASHAHPLIVKICDFGMAHNLPEGEIIYKEGSVGPRPFRWMSPEALNKGEFSVLSDIWSYGVVCWEVITLGSYPFGKMPNFAAAAKVAAGHILPRPSNCEPEIYAILKSCWRTKPSERASFESLEGKWSDILEANSDYIELRDFSLNDCE